jgi:hypothetical protein
MRVGEVIAGSFTILEKAQHLPYESVGIERFRDDERAGREHSSADLARSSDDRDRNIRLFSPQRFENSVAIDHRHHEVEQGEVELLLADDLDRFDSDARVEDFESVTLQVRANEPSDGIFVFRDEDSFRLHACAR